MCFEVKTIIKNCHCKKFTQGGLSTEGAQNGFLLGVSKCPKMFRSSQAAARKICLSPLGESGGMLPGKFSKWNLSNWLKMHFLPIVKITLPMLEVGP